jgi:putative FmdB family regulatory protein
MPTYEFRCPQGHEFEKFYRTIGSAESRVLCPECGQPAERLMSAAGFAFKGSGFYLTDYGKNAHRDKGTPDARSGAAADGGAESATTESKGESKTDAASAPAASAETKPAAEPKKGEAKAADPKPAALAKPAKKSDSE